MPNFAIIPCIDYLKEKFYNRYSFRVNQPTILVTGLTVALILLQAISPGPVYALSFSDVVNISNSGGESTVPRVASHAENVYVVWEDDDSGNDEILFATSNDAGETYLDPINISDTPSNSFDPQLATNEANDIFIVWREAVSDQAADIFLAKSSDNGTSFDLPTNISNTPDHHSSNPHIAVSDDNVFVAWEEDSSGLGINDIFIAASTNGGTTFADPINISNSSIASSSHQLFASGNYMFVAWREFNDTSFVGDIYFTASSDQGDTFSTPFKVSSDLAGDGFDPQLVVNDENVYIVWGDALLLDTYFASSTDGGVSFSEPINISNSGNVFNADPDIYATPNDIFLVWQDDLYGFTDIFLSRSTDNGATFTFPANVSNITDGSFSFNPRLVQSDAGKLYVAWQQDSPADTFLVMSTDGGATFGDPVNLSNTNGLDFVPSIALSASQNRLHLVWQDISVGATFDIFATTITDSGAPSISISPVSDSSPRWDLDQVVLTGTVNANATDSIIIEWGDDTPNNVTAVEGSSWGPVFHTYDSSATGITVITSKVLDQGGFEKASDSVEIEVEPHTTTISLNKIFTVIEGSNITASGLLIDAEDDSPVENRTIIFSGTGVTANLSSAMSNADGSYSSTGSSPNYVNEELLTVQALFEGDSAYLASNSNIMGYDTVASGTSEFDVPAGSPTGPIDMIGFNASILFDNVLSDGSIFVSSCDPPSSQRYIEIDGMCLKVSSAVTIADGSAAHITMSYDDIQIPDGYSEVDLDLFHENISGIVDITESRDMEGNHLIGSTTDFSRFIGGIALHDNPSVSASRQQVFVGNNEELLFEFKEKKEISFANSRLQIGEQTQVRVVDPYSNLDRGEIDSITTVLTSSSDPIGIEISLIETAQDTGIFVGSFTPSERRSSTDRSILEVSSRDTITGSYLAPNRASFRVEIDGVVEAGLAEVASIEAPAAMIPVGDWYELRLVDARLGSDSNIAIVMSYANVPIDFDPLQLRLALMNKTICINEVTYQGIDGINTTAMTVTGRSATAGQFGLVLNVRNTAFGDCDSLGPGGGGGGLPRPGTGIVLDAVASVISESSNNDGGGNGGGGHRTEVIVNTQNQNVSAVDVYPESYFEENPLDRIDLLDLGFFDAGNNQVNSSLVDQHISISSKLINKQKMPQEFLFVVMVVNENATATEISLQQGVVESGEIGDVTISWIPKDIGTYAIKILVWDGFDDPLPLSDMVVMHMTIG